MFILSPCLGYKTYESNQVLTEREKEWVTLYVACEKKAGAGSGVAGQRDGWVYLDLGQFPYAEKGSSP